VSWYFWRLSTPSSRNIPISAGGGRWATSTSLDYIGLGSGVGLNTVYGRCVCGGGGAKLSNCLARLVKPRHDPPMRRPRYERQTRGSDFGSNNTKAKTRTQFTIRLSCPTSASISLENNIYLGVVRPTRGLSVHEDISFGWIPDVCPLPRCSPTVSDIEKKRVVRRKGKKEQGCPYSHYRYVSALFYKSVKSYY